MRHWIVLVALLALVAAACGDDGSDAAVPATEPSEASAVPPPEVTPSVPEVRDPELRPAPSVVPVEPRPEDPAPAPAVVPSGLEPLVALAVGDLAARLEVAPHQITIVSAEAVVWPDGGLGCPRPGMQYLQVQVEGIRIVLAHQSTKYAYHGGGGRAPFLCEQ